MKKKEKRPAIGTILWDVHENLYYDKSLRTAPLAEYVVTPGEVTGFFEGRDVSVRLSGPIPKGNHSFPTPRHHKLSEIGKTVFYTAREAAELAKKRTEEKEKTITWAGEPPMRRTWEKYLTEEESHEGVES